MILLEILHYLLLIYLGASVLFLITYAILGNLPRKIKKSAKNKQHKFVVFIPGYKEDAVILEVAKEVLNQSYPKKII